MFYDINFLNMEILERIWVFARGGETRKWKKIVERWIVLCGAGIGS